MICAGCAKANNVAPRALQIQQNWQLQPGSEIAGHRILGGLGDVSIALNGDKVYAPFAGKVEPHQDDCVVFSSPEVPAYLLRLCGVRRPKLGQVEQGEAIASAKSLQFAALRRQPNGKWAMVEPSIDVLERTLK
jgi:hypothetical protein